VIRAGQLAEDVGLDAFFIGDHPGYATEPWLHLSAIAMTTTRIRLGSVVNCVAYRHPVMLARLAADLDWISNGRVILGLGIGWNAEEFGQLGLAFPSVRERQALLEESIAVITGVWGPQPFTFKGQHVWTEGGHVVPPPKQRPRPPILIAGGGERTTLRHVARYGDACNFGPGRNTGAVRSPNDVRRKLQVLRDHCQAIGRPFHDIVRTHFTTWLMLAETERAALKKLRRYYPEGLTEEQGLTRIYGTPELVRPYYQELADAGIEYFVVQTLDAADEETIRLLGEAVAPSIQPGPPLAE
jgi:alkanesulfonate monooxygenase SsuD/methylene tetrahydromethanopterin reductase-like flavin-dependent oxidoreductase (luciferase family)